MSNSKDELNNVDLKEIDLKYIDPLDVGPILKKDLVVFFLISTPGCMHGLIIDSINSIMEKLIPKLIKMGGSRANIKIAVLQISDGCSWINKEPISVYEYKWEPLHADGLNDLGAGFIELSKKLSMKEFLNSPALKYPPLMFLITTGYSTDDAYAGLEELQKNNWYRYGLKIGLVIGKENCDRELLKEFTRDESLIFEVRCPAQIADKSEFYYELEELMNIIVLNSVDVAVKEIILPHLYGVEEYSYGYVIGIKSEYLSLSILQECMDKKRTYEAEQLDEINETDFDKEYYDLVKLKREEKLVFFLLDTSSSMAGEKIDALNRIIEETIIELKAIAENYDEHINLAIMNFSTDCKWLTENPVPIKDYPDWTLLKAEGDCNMGAAFIELSKKLTRKEFLKDNYIYGTHLPVILLFTDGYYTDDVYAGLDELKQNAWYDSVKVAVGIGEDDNKELLEKFAENEELVFPGGISEQIISIFSNLCSRSYITIS